MIVELIETRIDRKDPATQGWQVQVMYRPVMEDMYESFRHFVVFEDKAEAERLVDRIKEAMRTAPVYDLIQPLNLKDHWTWVVTRASPFGFMRDMPTAKLTFRPAVSAIAI